MDDILDAIRYLTATIEKDMYWGVDFGVPIMAAQTWHMPDGTKTTNRPKDGSILHTFDSQGIGTTWQWDDFLESWHNVTTAKPNNYNTATHYIKLPNPIEWVDVKIDIDLGIKKCECGSEKVGSPKHSSWCAKFDPRT